MAVLLLFKDFNKATQAFGKDVHSLYCCFSMPCLETGEADTCTHINCGNQCNADQTCVYAHNLTLKTEPCLYSICIALSV